MADKARYFGVNFNNLRKALYLLFFGAGEVKDKSGRVIRYLCDSFDSPNYKYIIPIQGNFENPLELKEKDTYVMFWIERDSSLTQDDYDEEHGKPVNRQKCVASILLRFIGAEAEDWAKSLRHLTKRSGVTKIWSGVCNAEKLEFTSPVIPRKISYSGLNSQIAFDIRFKLFYDEVISTGWLPLEGISMNFIGDVTVED